MVSMSFYCNLLLVTASSIPERVLFSEQMEPGAGIDSATSRALYNAWSSSYTETVDEWGYELPERVAEALAGHLLPPSEDHMESGLRILDAGSGDGLSGGALRAVGFVGAHVTAFDISPELLAIARLRDVYNAAVEGDLSQRLPFDDASFDVVSCVDVLTHVAVGSGVLSEFVRVGTEGALLAFSLRTDHIAAWEDELQRLEAAGAWETVHRSEPLPYLPGHRKHGDAVLAVVFLCRVL